MSEESSPRGDTSENTYIDLGAETDEAYAISKKSRTLARSALGNISDEDRVRQRCSVAVGDFSFAATMRFCNDPVAAALAALEQNAQIITDIRMVQVGIQKKGHGSGIICALDFGRDLAKDRGITRTSAGFLELGDRIRSAIVVIGNAPSALSTVCDCIGKGVRPAVVIGTPVGFVNAAESKAALRALSIPSISNEGTRGGTPVAVAAMNEIITLFVENTTHARSRHRV